METHYSPVENLEAIDRAQFDQAQQTIDLCAYSLTDFALGEALTRAAARGVRIRIYLDQGQASSELGRESRRPSSDEGDSADNPLTGVLEKLSVTPNIEVRVKHSRTLMHLKSYAVDNSLLRSGSANFSPSGEKHQDNDLTITKDPNAIQRYEGNFDRIWARTDNQTLSRP